MESGMASTEGFEYDPCKEERHGFLHMMVVVVVDECRIVVLMVTMWQLSV
jgi:hypothetical protein